MNKSNNSLVFPSNSQNLTPEEQTDDKVLSLVLNHSGITTPLRTEDIMPHIVHGMDVVGSWVVMLAIFGGLADWNVQPNSYVAVPSGGHDDSVNFILFGSQVQTRHFLEWRAKITDPGEGILYVSGKQYVQLQATLKKDGVEIPDFETLLARMGVQKDHQRSHSVASAWLHNLQGISGFFSNFTQNNTLRGSLWGTNHIRDLATSIKQIPHVSLSAVLEKAPKRMDSILVLGHDKPGTVEMSDVESEFSVIMVEIWERLQEIVTQWPSEEAGLEIEKLSKQLHTLARTLQKLEINPHAVAILKNEVGNFNAHMRNSNKYAKLLILMWSMTMSSGNRKFDFLSGESDHDSFIRGVVKIVSSVIRNPISTNPDVEELRKFYTFLKDHKWTDMKMTDLPELKAMMTNAFPFLDKTTSR